MLKSSLERGVPVMISLRSFGGFLNENQLTWKGISNHFVVLTKIPKQLGDHDLGFSFEYKVGIQRLPKTLVL